MNSFDEKMKEALGAAEAESVLLFSRYFSTNQSSMTEKLSKIQNENSPEWKDTKKCIILAIDRYTHLQEFILKYIHHV